MPSINEFINWSRKRLCWIKYGVKISDKLDLLTYALLNSFPRTLRNKVSIIENMRLSFLSRFEITFEGKVMCVNGTKYALIDDESFRIVIPRFEPWMWNYLKPKEGDVFLDVGAHIGKYTLQVAKIVGESGSVIAIEPMTECYKALKEGISLNNFNNITPLNIAAWNKSCNLKLFIGDKYGHNSIKYNMGLGYVEVEAKALDTILSQINVNRVDWIKIDVEGAEYEVLQGLKNTLKKDSPKLIVEVKKENERKVMDIMKELNYKVYPINDSLQELHEYYYFRRDTCGK